MPILPSPSQGDMYTVREVAQFFSVSVDTVRRWCTDAYIPHIKVGGRLRFDPKALQAWTDALPGQADGSHDQ